MSAPMIRTEFLEGKANVTALGINSVAIVVDKDDPIVVNRIAVEVRAYFKRRDNGTWYATNMFAYRLDNQETYHPQHPATEGQQQKIYRAGVELCEELNETFLREGEVANVDREIARIDDRIRQHEDERQKLVRERIKYELLG